MKDLWEIIKDKLHQLWKIMPSQWHKNVFNIIIAEKF